MKIRINPKAHLLGGGTDYSDAMYTSRMSAHKTAGTDPFAHTASVKSGASKSGVHESLDPKKPNKAGKNIRESFDSDVHPDSVAVAVLWDVTGSMQTVPRIFLEKMPKLMAALVKKGYIAHPHIMFGAIGDATCDDAPLQIGQFEGGNEMDDALTNIFLEGGGGGQKTESYELAMYYMARHTDMDCFTKRGKKGYLFILGDELPYNHVSKKEVEEFIGDRLQADITTKEILAELRKKFEVIWIMPNLTSYFDDESVCGPLKTLFGENFRRLQEPGDVCEFIAATIGLLEGYDLNGIKRDLKDLGADADAVDRVSTALVPFAAKAVTKGATASAALVESGGGDAVTRL